MGKPLELTGKIFGKLTVVRRGAGYTSPGGTKFTTWICLCECGNSKDILGISLKSGHSMSCGCLVKEGFTREGGKGTRTPAQLSYHGAHRRIKDTRGKASEFDCIDCGSKAKEWSYIHGAADNELSVFRSIWGAAPTEVKYSEDPDDYEPRCKSCHAKYDRGVTNGQDSQ